MRDDAARSWLSPVPAWLLQTAVIFACVHPIVARLRHPRLPDWVVPLVVVLLGLTVLIGAAVFVGTRVVAQLPELRDQAIPLRQDLSQRTDVDLPPIPGVGSQSSSIGSSAESRSGRAGEAAVAALSIGTGILVGLFLTMALAFLFLKDGSHMWQLFDATAIAIGLAILGVPVLVTLAVPQFFGSYVPTFGGFVAGAVLWVARVLLFVSLVAAASAAGHALREHRRSPEPEPSWH